MGRCAAARGPGDDHARRRRGERRDARPPGAWVFAGGLHPPSTATVVRRRRTATCSSPTARSPRARSTSAASGSSRRPTWTPRSAGPQGHARRRTPAGRGAPVPGRGRGLTPGRAGPRPPRTIERVFREEYGRAVAVLVRVFGDIDIAEEAVQDAFAAAVQRWPADRAAPEPGRLDHHHRPQPGDRPAAPGGLPRRTGTPRPPCCTPATNRPRRRARCATTGCA